MKIKLKFMVVPEQLSAMAFVPNAVRVRIIDPEAIFLMGILGESGRRLVEHGIEFYFEGSLAQKLIDKGIAIRVVKQQSNQHCTPERIRASERPDSTNINPLGEE